MLEIREIKMKCVICEELVIALSEIFDVKVETKAKEHYESRYNRS